MTNKGDLISRSELLKLVPPEEIVARMAIMNAPTVEAYPFEQVHELVKLNQQFAREIENLKRPTGEEE